MKNDFRVHSRFFDYKLILQYYYIADLWFAIFDPISSIQSQASRNLKISVWSKTNV